MIHIIGALLVIAVIAVGLFTPVVVAYGMGRQWYRDRFIHVKAPAYRTHTPVSDVWP